MDADYGICWFTILISSLTTDTVTQKEEESNSIVIQPVSVCRYDMC